MQTNRMSFRRPAGFLGPLFLGLAFLATGCGTSFETVKVKNYRLAVLEESAQFNRTFRSLIGDFNECADMQALSYETDPAKANSAIVMTDGLRERDGKVGWGQWLAETRKENPVFRPPGAEPKKIVTYSMRLEFDTDYMRKRIESPSSDHTRDLQKLFFHEVGHGMKMDHHPDSSRVMHHDISGDKDFSGFCQRVRNFMKDRG